jgi:hypothetical protein
VTADAEYGGPDIIECLQGHRDCPELDHFEPARYPQAVAEPEPSRPYMCVGFRAADKFDGHITRFKEGGAAAILDMFGGFDGSIQFYSSAHLRELADVARRLADELAAAEASQ